MNKSKTMVQMENDTLLHVKNIQIENVESYWDRDTAPETKSKTRRFKEESRPDGHHSPNTATSSRVICNTGTCLKRQVYNSCVLPAMTYGACYNR